MTWDRNSGFQFASRQQVKLVQWNPWQFYIIMRNDYLAAQCLPFRWNFQDNWQFLRQCDLKQHLPMGIQIRNGRQVSCLSFTQITHQLNGFGGYMVANFQVISKFWRNTSKMAKIWSHDFSCFFWHEIKTLTWFYHQAFRASNLNSLDFDCEVNLSNLSSCKYYSCLDFLNLTKQNNNSNNVKIFHNNLNGLELKFEHLHSFLSSNLSDFDIVTFNITSFLHDCLPWFQCSFQTHKTLLMDQNWKNIYRRIERCVRYNWRLRDITTRN